jgi:SHS2 domain-containing protein
MNASPTAAGYQELEHTADLRLRVWAADLAGLFAQAALGLAALLRCRAPVSARPRRQALHLCRLDAESLLVAWLSELLYLNESDGLCCTGFDLHLAQDEDGALVLAAQLEGATGCLAGRSIKAVTYHDLSVVSRPGGGVEAVITFDV